MRASNAPGHARHMECGLVGVHCPTVACFLLERGRSARDSVRGLDTVRFVGFVGLLFVASWPGEVIGGRLP
eukprot:16449569-Heterocapsa_arctica.AAC.1